MCARECLDGWVASRGGDTALVLFVSAHPDVAILSPACTPGVLDQPVSLAIVAAIADSEDTVVEAGGGASPLVVYTRSVQL